MFKKLLASIASNPWKSYAETIGATYVDGGFAQSDRIVAQQGVHDVVVNIGTNQRGNKGFRYTRFRSSYLSTSNPYFCIQTKQFHLGLGGLFSKKSSADLPIQKLYDISTPKEELVTLLLEEEKMCTYLNVLSHFKLVSEKDDGEWGPIFLATEHQLCLELEGEIETPHLLSAGIGIIFATLEVLEKNGFLMAEKTSVKY